MIYIDLLLDNGELVRIEVPKNREGECRDSIENQMKIGGWWSVSCWQGASATYLGHRIDHVNMRRVVAML
jgi:hypothetical protein